MESKATGVNLGVTVNLLREVWHGRKRGGRRSVEFRGR